MVNGSVEIMHGDEAILPTATTCGNIVPSRKVVKVRSIFLDTTPVDIRSLIRAIHFKEARPPLSVCCTITPRSDCYSMVATTSKML